MKTEIGFFDLYPKVVAADKKTEIRIKPLFADMGFPEKSKIRVFYVSVESNIPDGKCSQVQTLEPLKFKIKNGEILLDIFFAGESEHSIKMDFMDGEITKKSLLFRVYSLKKDLFKLKPYKGDFHLHSTCSDGREAPAYVAASCRKIGFDFMALTDHRKMEPSLEAIKKLSALKTDFKMYPGEEVHPPDNPTHIVNFGGKFSLNSIFRDNKGKYDAETKKTVSRLKDVPEGIRTQTASCEWCFEKIRQGGGLAVFCHPYWEPGGRFYISEALTSQIFKRKKFDAFELIGGYFPWQAEANNLQVARYVEERAGGNDFPVVGLSDSHGCERNELFGWYYTVVLAASAELEDIIKGIKDFKSVAVDAPVNQRICVYGHFRIVKYVNFLIREYFPIHDRLCEEEGKLMIEYLRGNAGTVKQIASFKGRIPLLLKRYWDIQA